VVPGAGNHAGIRRGQAPPAARGRDRQVSRAHAPRPARPAPRAPRARPCRAPRAAGAVGVSGAQRAGSAPRARGSPSFPSLPSRVWLCPGASAHPSGSRDRRPRPSSARVGGGPASARAVRAPPATPLAAPSPAPGRDPQLGASASRCSVLQSLGSP
jgi:hypothetical protein